MSKRSAPSSPAQEHHSAKKQKLESPASSPAEHGGEQAQTQDISDNFHGDHETQDDRDATKSPLDNLSGEPGVSVKSPAAPEPTEPAEAKKEKRKAGQGFEPWKPAEASQPIPDVQPHWGIIPRPGGTRPLGPQPSARTSDGAIVPPLWEDRKGAVRIKRGARIIDGYDQAQHLYLRLMDVRPASKKDQTPRREPIGYYYPHGMPADWSNTGAINDVNKALQAAIHAKTKQEQPFTANERKVLAGIFASNPDITLWDAAEMFNDQAHKIASSEAGQYPTGRFTESIHHEFSIYKNTYLKGVAPTDEIEKEIELEQRYKQWKADRAKAKTDARRAARKASHASGKMSDTNGVTKKKRPSKKKEFSPNTLADMVDRADATARKIEREEAEEEAAKAAAEAAKAAAEAEISISAESPVPMIEQPRLLDDEEELLEAGGAYAAGEARVSSPVSARTHAVVASPDYGVMESGSVEEAQRVVVDQVVQANNIDDKAGETVVQTEVVAASTAVSSTYVEKAAREIEINEDYRDEDEV